jgi:hypothetical protein
MGEKDPASDPVRPAKAHGSGNVPHPAPAAIAAPGGSRPRRLLMIAAVIAGLGVLTTGIALAVFSSPGVPVNHSVAGPASTPASPAPSRQVATGPGGITPPGVASDGIAKTALRFPKRLTRQVSRWEAGPGGTALAAVTAQMGYALQAAGAKLYPVMEQACARLASGIQTAQAGPPIPDAAMQRMYGRALARLSHGAANCRNAISIRQAGDETSEIHVHEALLARSRMELAAGSKTLYNATAEIRAA